MKTALIALSLLVAAGAYAQTDPSHGCEQPRSTIRPYASVDEAMAAADGSSKYIVPITEWQRDEKDGSISFTAEYVYPAAWLNRQVLLRIDGASGGYEVTVNGAQTGHTTNGTVQTEFNLTRKSKQGLNTLTVTFPANNATRPLHDTGIVWLGKAEIISQPTIRVRDIDLSTRLNDSGDGIAEIGIIVKTDALNPKSTRIYYELLAPDTTRLAYGHKEMTLGMRGEDTVKFSTIVPQKWLWSAENPALVRLVIRNMTEGRYTENIVVSAGLRAVENRDGKLTVNGRETTLFVKEVDPTVSAQELAELKAEKYNAVTFAAGEAPQSLYASCDAAGIYVIPQTAIDTSKGADSIKRGGNPSNDPEWQQEYLARTAEMYHTSKPHASVVAFSLGNGITNGINTYESYLMLKGLEHDRPIIYNGARKEWNNDPTNIVFAPDK